MERLALSYNLIGDDGFRALAQGLAQGASSAGRGSKKGRVQGRGDGEEAGLGRRGRGLPHQRAAVRVDSLAMEGCGLGESACKLLSGARVRACAATTADPARILNICIES